MVGLDDSGFTTAGFSGFHHIRVDGALGQPVYVLNGGCFLIEHIDEGIADDAALFLRILDALQQGSGIDPRHCDG